MMKNGVLFAELFEILIYGNKMTCDVTLLTNDVQSQKMEYL